MYCLESFNRQLKIDMKPHAASFKFYCVKMVFSLSLYQNLIMSLLMTSWLPAKIRNNMAPSANLNAFDIKIGIPYFLLSLELAIIAILHLFAFPFGVYMSPPETPDYPMSPYRNELGSKQGGILGFRAMTDSINLWEFVKSLGRSFRWLFIGRRTRENDASYKMNLVDENDLALGPNIIEMHGYQHTESLPIADEFRRSKFGMPKYSGGQGGRTPHEDYVYKESETPRNDDDYVLLRARVLEY
ncbi:uncharacterized protein PAC_15715 [Phialocephala subalpina]|uniref:Uncharacterized protein n=1 Tax=Phialocephala subalpina TaxID=576137 RepID=A0A1L7XL82_9HELO|nr:uncharacterized protein PAC_15715 [Phialocephala subalpina]